MKCSNPGWGGTVTCGGLRFASNPPYATCITAKRQCNFPALWVGFPTALAARFVGEGEAFGGRAGAGGVTVGGGVARLLGGGIGIVPAPATERRRAQAAAISFGDSPLIGGLSP